MLKKFSEAMQYVRMLKFEGIADKLLAKCLFGQAFW